MKDQSVGINVDSSKPKDKATMQTNAPKPADQAGATAKPGVSQPGQVTPKPDASKPGEATPKPDASKGPAAKTDVAKRKATATKCCHGKRCQITETEHKCWDSRNKSQHIDQWHS